MMENDSKPKFYCEFCKYGTDRKHYFNKHNLTNKHKRNKQKVENEKIENAKKKEICDFCTRTFKTRGGKYKHVQKCAKNPDRESKIKNNLEISQKDLEISLLKERLSGQKEIIFKLLDLVGHQNVDLTIQNED